jgi:hypothetical protein
VKWMYLGIVQLEQCDMQCHRCRSRGLRFHLAIHESFSLSVSAAWTKPIIASFRRPSGSCRTMIEVSPCCALPLSAFGVVLSSMSGVSCVCHASPAYVCFVCSSSNSSLRTRGLPWEWMVEDWFKDVLWQGVRWQRRLARAKALPS